MSEAFKTYWLSWAGPPGRVVADQGKESFGVFSELMRCVGTHFNLTALEAPWLNGMVERHGGVLGDIISVTVLYVINWKVSFSRFLAEACVSN